MKCPLCAEEIQAAAVLCRFCGAQKTDNNGVDSWQPSASSPSPSPSPSPVPAPSPAPAPAPAPAVKGTFTLRSAGFLLILSAVFEAFSITTPVVLFGELRSGGMAGAYHLMFVAVFLLMGIGLWSAKHWGYRAVLIGTGIYVADRLLYMFDAAGRSASIASAARTLETLLGPIDLQPINQIILLVALISIACWIGFAWYVHSRKAYFHQL